MSRVFGVALHDRASIAIDRAATDRPTALFNRFMVASGVETWHFKRAAGSDPIS